MAFWLELEREDCPVVTASSVDLALKPGSPSRVGDSSVTQRVEDIDWNEIEGGLWERKVDRAEVASGID